MDVITYALLKKKISSIAGGISGYEVDGLNLKITTSDGQVLTMTFPEPKDGVSITDIDINEQNHLLCTMSDETEIDAGEIKTVQGPKGDPFKYEDFTPEQLEQLKGPAGEDGKDGYTPQKGVDYFTDDDKQEIKDSLHLEDYYTKTEADKTFLKEHQSLDGYLKEETADTKYATKAEIPDTKDFITEEKADSKYATKEQIPNLDDYYTKEQTYSSSEIDDKIAEAASGGSIDLNSYLKKEEASETYLDKATAEDTYAKKGEQPELTDYLKKQEAETTYAKKDDIPSTDEFLTKTTANETYETKIEHKADLDKKVDAVIENEKGTAAILNNETGGQLLYLNNENNIRANISVNDGSSNVYAQLSVTDKDTNMGARIDVDNEKAYYTTGKDTPEVSADDELVTKKDVYSKAEADEKFLTEHQDLSAYATNAGIDHKLENYYDKDTSDGKYADKDYTYSKADIDEKIATAGSGGQISLDGYLKTEDADKKFATKENLDGYVEERVVGDKGIALISNDPTGGLMKFTSNTGEEMGVAVNDGSEGIYTQMYAKDAESGDGTRLTLDKEHAYIKTGNDHTFSDDDIIITKKDLPIDIDNFITDTEVDTKLEEYYSKTDIDNKHFLTEHQDLTDYMKTADADLKYVEKSEITDFITEETVDSKLESYVDKTTADSTYAKSEDLSNYETTAHATETYATKDEIPSLDAYITEVAADEKYASKDEIADFVTETTVDSKLENYYDKQTADSTFLKEHQDLTGYAKTEDVAKEYATKTEIADFITEETVDNKLENYIDKTTADETYVKTTDIQDFITDSEVDTKLESYYTKEDIDGKNYLTEHQSLENYYTKGDIDVKGFITKAVEDLTNYYTKSETYTQEEIDEKINAVKSTSFKKVNQLPETGETNIIYLVPAEEVGEQNKYIEYIYVEEAWEKIGELSSNVDLTEIEQELAKKANSADVYTKTEADDKFVEKQVKGGNGTATISNDPSGGLLKFETNDGKASGVAVNDGSEEIYAQIYAKDKETNTGARLSVNTKGAYYTVGDSISFEEKDKLVTKKELPSLENYMRTETADAKYATKEDTYTKNQIDQTIADIQSGGGINLESYLQKTEAEKTYAKKDECEANYAKKAELDLYAKSSTVYSKEDADVKFATNDAMNAALEKKVTAEEGKQLSQENFTTVLKDKLDSLENADLTNYYNKQEVDARIPNVESFITIAVDNLENYYTKTETYTQNEIDAKIAATRTTSFRIVEELPNRDVQPNVIYLVKSETSTEQNQYTEYIYIEASWEKIGVLETTIRFDELQAEIDKKANAEDVYTKEIADQTFAKPSDIPTKLPNPEALTLTFNKQPFVTYDGTAAVNEDIDIDVSAIPGLDEEIERLIAEHGTTEGFYPFESGKGIWELEDAAYVIKGKSQDIKYDNYERTSLNNGGYLYITSDSAYKYFIIIKNTETYFNIEYGRVTLDGSASNHSIFSTQTLIDLSTVKDSVTLEII